MTSPTYGRWGFFLFAVGSDMSGNIQSYDRATLVAEDKDLKALGIGAVGGISYRFMGESKSKFAAGAFFGPGYMYLKSSFQSITYVPTSYSPKSNFEITVLSAYSGVQAQWRINKITINPYFLYMKEISNNCTIDQPGFSSGSGPCDTAYSSADLAPDTSFSGFGLFLGYGDLRLNVYSKANFDDAMKDFEYTNYSLSYTFGSK